MYVDFSQDIILILRLKQSRNIYQIVSKSWKYETTQNVIHYLFHVAYGYTAL